MPRTDQPANQFDSRSSRDPVDRISDEVLTKPLRLLSPAERGMVRRALKGERADEFNQRILALHRRNVT